MTNFYIYADESSHNVLLEERQKAILIGGDFGYGNFGDVLQHINAIRLVKDTGRYAVVSVMAANAISRSGFPAWALSAYGADAILFIAEYPLILDDASPRLKLVGEIRNLAVVHLYGGGFLNSMWGDYVLSVTEGFLRLAPGAHYIVSGQQITPPYQSRVVTHVNEFSPRWMGVRDGLSQQCLREAGVEAQYSFDDATEALIALGQRVRLKREVGLLLHLNSSDYTANACLQSGIGYELGRLQATNTAKQGVTLFQAFRDTRQEVFDSSETVKQLDAGFPFYDHRVVDLVGLILSEEHDGAVPAIGGHIGYSCSYHVALWLQLAGIPCWLRSNNAFYDQKSRALQVTQDLEAFIHDPKLADHRLNLERRASWRALLSKELANLPDIRNLCQIPDVTGGPAPWPFFFKGTPTLQEKLVDVGHEAHRQQERAEMAERELKSATNEIGVLSGRIEALIAQITDVGHEAHRQRERADVAEHQSEHVEFTLKQIYASRSWQITRPFRSLMRYLRHGHFDSRGEVGVFALIQRTTRPLPIPSRLRARLGRFLTHFRRR